MPQVVHKFAISIVAAIVLAGPACADEPIDRQALQTELAELRSIAERLAERIHAVERKLDRKSNELRINDIVSVKFLLTPKKSSIDESPENKEAYRVLHAAVVDMFPNGDLKLSGRRKVSNNGVVYEETLTGIVARKSIDSTRTVRSDAIQDLSYRVVEVPERRR